MKLQKLCKVHPLGYHKGQMLYLRKKDCPTCRPKGWIKVPSAEGKGLNREHCAELISVLRRAIKKKVRNSNNNSLLKLEYTPSEWVEPMPEKPHDNKGHSEEKCLRCGWVMGDRPLNCINNDTPHMFPSQQDEIERLRAAIDAVDDLHSPLAHDTCLACGHDWPCPTHQLIHPEEARHD